MFGGRYTGVGSLPFLGIDEAVRFVCRRSAEIPFVPQIPRAGASFGMLVEPFAEHLDVVHPDGNGRLAVNKGDLARFGEILRDPASPSPRQQTVALCAALRGTSPWGMKTQLVGPCHFLTSLSHGGQPIGRELERDVVRYLTRLLVAETRLMSRLARRMYVALDEPALPFLKVRAIEPLLADVDAMARELKAEGAEVGIHCCAPILGEKLNDLLARLPLDFISVALEPWGGPVAQQCSRSLLQAVAERGGGVLFGIVPTDRTVEKFDAEGAVDWLLQELRSTVELRTALDTSMLRERCGISATCGVGLRSEEDADRVFLACERTSAAFRGALTP